MVKNTNPILSVIICSAQGNLNTLKFSLKAILEQKIKIPFEVIVTNDGFDEKILNLIDTYKKYLDLQYFDRKNDMCLSRSRNIAVKNSKGKYLVFIDSDIILNPLALNSYYNLLWENKNTSVWGEYHFQGKKDIRLVMGNKEYQEYINSKRNIILYFKPFYHTFAGSFGLKKEIYQQIGGFCEDFVGYGYEDKEFAYRLYKNKIKFIFSENVSAIHLGNSENDSDFYNKDRIKKNSNLLLKKLFEDIKYFYLLDENIVIKEFEYVHKFIGNLIYLFYITYFLSRNNEKKAFEYTQIAEKYLEKNSILNLWKEYSIKKENNDFSIWY